MGKKSKVRKQMRKRDLEDELALVICTGKKCAPRAETEPLVNAARELLDVEPGIHLVTVGCLHVCKRGPIATTYPKIKLEKRVDVVRVEHMVAKLIKRRARTAR